MAMNPVHSLWLSAWKLPRTFLVCVCVCVRVCVCARARACVRVYRKP